MTKNPQKTIEQSPKEAEAITDDTATATPGRAEQIAQILEVDRVFENLLTGEFFTLENLALLSVGGQRKNIKTHYFNPPTNE